MEETDGREGREREKKGIRWSKGKKRVKGGGGMDGKKNGRGSKG